MEFRPQHVFVIVFLLMVLFVCPGCGSKKTPPPSPGSSQGTTVQPLPELAQNKIAARVYEPRLSMEPETLPDYVPDETDHLEKEYEVDRELTGSAVD